jgi:protoheme IX farnesyltransferase
MNIRDEMRGFSPAWSGMLRFTAPAAAALIFAAIAAADFAHRVGLELPFASWGGGSTAAYVSTALFVDALVLVAAVAAFRSRVEPLRQPAFATPFARLALALVPFVFLALVSGSYVTASGAAGVCEGWPFCSRGLVPQNALEWIASLHRLAVGATGVLVVWALALGWRTQRYQPATLVTLTVAALLFLAQVLIGAVLSVRSADLTMIALHAATGPAVWAAVVVLAINVGFERSSVEREGLSAFRSDAIRERLRDYLTLTKPIIVLLLLATTLAGMVVGLRAWPPIATIAWTLLGGALAAGGSGAINQFIDRDVDAQMKRTARRPIAAGRLSPAEGLAFGVGLCLLAFYVLVVFINLLAAVLSVVGMFYYIWLYSIVLKKATVQNIVIGGGAGSIPPLVGWAAATGSLTLPALLLFVIIFFWTPPHFWALALVRSKDYARGGIPMLPVVRGERETRRQILVYTVALVGITLLAPIAGLAGVVYLAGAILLGAALIAVAWRLWRDYSPKLAWRMYRWSSMYLLLLFVWMMVDALI